MGVHLCREACLPRDGFGNLEDNSLYAADVNDENFGPQDDPDICKKTAVGCHIGRVGPHSYLQTIHVLPRGQPRKKTSAGDKEAALTDREAAIPSATVTAMGSVASAQHEKTKLALQDQPYQGRHEMHKKVLMPLEEVQGSTPTTLSDRANEPALSARLENPDYKKLQECTLTQSEGAEDSLKSRFKDTVVTVPRKGASSSNAAENAQRRKVVRTEKQAEIAQLEEQASRLRGQLAETHRKLRAARQDPKTPIWVEMVPDRSDADDIKGAKWREPTREPSMTTENVEK